MKKKKLIASFVLIGALGMNLNPNIYNINTVHAEENSETIDPKQVLNIPDENFRFYIIKNILGSSRVIPEGVQEDPNYKYPIYGSDLEKIKSIEALSIGEWQVNRPDKFSLEGIEYFTNLKKIETKQIKIEEADFTKNKNLEEIRLLNTKTLNNINVNGLDKLKILELSMFNGENIDLSTNINLEKLQVTSDSNRPATSGLKSIDLTNNTKLNSLNLSFNQLDQINLKGQNDLEELLLTNSKIKSLHIDGLSKLKSLTFSSEHLEDFSLKNCDNLEYLYLDKSKIKELNLENVPLLKLLRLDYTTELKSVNLDNLKALQSLSLTNSNIESLSVKNCENLKKIEGYKAKLKSIDLSGLNNLKEVDFRNNELNQIKLKNDNLDKLKLSNNKLENIDLAQTPKLRYLECENNEIEKLETKNLPLNNIVASNNHLKVLDLSGSNISNENNAKLSIQTITIPGNMENGKLQVDLGEIVGKENLSNIINVENGEYDKNSGIVKTNDNKFAYNYKTATKQNWKKVDFDIIMKVEVNILNSNAISEMTLITGPNRTEYKVNEKFSPEGIIVQLKDDKGITLNIKPEEFEKYGIKIDKTELKKGDKEVILTKGDLKISIPIKVSNYYNGGSSNSNNNSNKGKSYIEGYPDGTIKPDEQISRAEAAKMIAYAIKNMDNSQIYETKFKDVLKDSWYKNIIGFLEKEKAIKGYQDGNFRPDDKISRAEFTSIIARLNGFTENKIESKFTDINKHWAENYIKFSEEKNWVKGYEDNTFKPENKITRAEAITIINRILGIKIDKQEIKNNINKYKSFKDLDEKHWAYYDILKATNLE